MVSMETNVKMFLSWQADAKQWAGECVRGGAPTKFQEHGGASDNSSFVSIGHSKGRRGSFFALSNGAG